MDLIRLERSVLLVLCISDQRAAFNPRCSPSSVQSTPAHVLRPSFFFSRSRTEGKPRNRASRGTGGGTEFSDRRRTGNGISMGDQCRRRRHPRPGLGLGRRVAELAGCVGSPVWFALPRTRLGASTLPLLVGLGGVVCCSESEDQVLVFTRSEKRSSAGSGERGTGRALRWGGRAGDDRRRGPGELGLRCGRCGGRSVGRRIRCLTGERAGDEYGKARRRACSTS